jgi:hypothetical protein
MIPLHTDKKITQHMIDASPDMMDALLRLTHPMADDDDVEFARATIRKARGFKPTDYEDIRESCHDKCAADAIGGNSWANI